MPLPTAPAHLSVAEAEDLALYQGKFRRHLPESLEELRGPVHGVVELPLHIAWSGLASYSLEKSRQLMGLYRTVLHDGLSRFLSQELLLEMWPFLRTLVGRTVRGVWEDAFPLLSSRVRSGA